MLSPSSAPFLSVAFTSNPNTLPTSLLKLAVARICPLTESMANRRFASSFLLRIWNLTSPLIPKSGSEACKPKLKLVYSLWIRLSKTHLQTDDFVTVTCSCRNSRNNRSSSRHKLGRVIVYVCYPYYDLNFVQTYKKQIFVFDLQKSFKRNFQPKLPSRSLVTGYTITVISLPNLYWSSRTTNS